MNERIKQLAEQASGMSIGQELTIFASGDGVGKSTFSEKFAQLIVQECSKVIVNGGYWSGGPLGPKRQCTPPEIAQMIKQHFGVEE